MSLFLVRLCALGTVCDRNTLEWNDLRYQCDRMGQKVGLRFAFPSPLCGQAGGQNHRSQCPMDAHFGVVEMPPSSTHLWSQESCNHWAHDQILWVDSNASLDYRWDVRNHSIEIQTLHVRFAFSEWVQRQPLHESLKPDRLTCEKWSERMRLCVEYGSGILYSLDSMDLAKAVCCPIWLVLQILKPPKWSKHLSIFARHSWFFLT